MKKIIKNIKLAIHSILGLIFLILSVVLWGGFIWFMLSLKLMKDTVLHKHSKLWGRLIFFVLGIKVKVEGKEYLNPNENYIFMMNHESMLDIPLTLGYIPNFFVMIAKVELFRIPVFGAILHKMKYIPIEREHKRNAIESIKKAAKIAKERKVSIGIYPEGTRTRTGELNKFKKGGFYLALETGYKIVPVAIEGNYENLPPGKWWLQDNREVKLTIFEPIDVKNYSKENIDELINLVKSKIEEGIKK